MKEMRRLLYNIKTRHCPLWDVMIAGPPRCRLVTVPTDSFTRPTGQFLSEWAQCQPGNAQNGRTVHRESDRRFCVGKPKFLFVFHSNHRSISLSFRDICVRRTMRTVTIAGHNTAAGQLGLRTETVIKTETNKWSKKFDKGCTE